LNSELSLRSGGAPEISLTCFFPIAGGGEYGAGGVAAEVGEVNAAQALMFLEIADDGLNGGTPLNSRLLCGVRLPFWPLM